METLFPGRGQYGRGCGGRLLLIDSESALEIPVRGDGRGGFWGEERVAPPVSLSSSPMQR